MSLEYFVQCVKINLIPSYEKIYRVIVHSHKLGKCDGVSTSHTYVIQDTLHVGSSQNHCITIFL